MDSFEDLMGWLSALNERDLEQWKEQAMRQCLCSECPSNLLCEEHHMDGLYCIEGRDQCNDQLGLPDACRCVDCPMALKNDLIRLFYCHRGAEQEIRGT